MSRILIFVSALAIISGCSSKLPVASTDPHEDMSLALETTSDSSPSTDPVKPQRRQFRFVYGATLTDIEPGTEVRVWLPVPPTNHEQTVTVEDLQLPAEYQKTTEKRYGNQLFFFTATADKNGEVPIKISYLVDRAELRFQHREKADDPSNRLYLTSDRLVPVEDQLRVALLGNESLQGETIEVARRLYEAVDDRLKYDKPTDRPGWGRGDAVWACGNGFGNCTDFHSLFISVARNLKIPSRFEIGFMIPPRSANGPQSGAVGGYHCWAKFLADGHWVPVDISEADKHPEKRDFYFGNLGDDRVTFTVGRDLELDPPSTAGAVNYLVYPYAEIAGRQHTSMRNEFRYADVQP
jgi:transglutaminase-like putative cysteine protease